MRLKPGRPHPTTKAEGLNLDHMENRGRSGASSWLCLCCSSCGPGNAEAGLNLTGSHGLQTCTCPASRDFPQPPADSYISNHLPSARPGLACFLWMMLACVDASTCHPCIGAMFGGFSSLTEDNGMLLRGLFESMGDMRSSLIRSQSFVFTSRIESLLEGNK